MKKRPPILEPRPSTARTLLIAASLICLTVIVYWPATSGGFVSYDDPDYVTRNRIVQQGLTWQGVTWAFTTTAVANWHPLAWLSHMLDCELYQLNPWGHHFSSVVLHAIAAAVLFLALARMTSAPWRSALVSALFALHPQHVQSVAWVAERKDVLSALVAFITILLYAAYVQRGGTARYVLVIIGYAIGLLAKPMLVTLPVLLLMLDIWPLNRFRIALINPKTRIQNPISLHGLLLEKTPLFILAAGSSIITIIAQKRGGTVSTLEIIPLGARIANAVVSYGWYVWKTVWPVELAVFHPHPGHWPSSIIVIASLALLAISTVACVVARRRPAVPIGWLWFLIALLPVIGIVQVGSQSFADRYSYIPQVGLFIMAAFALPATVRTSDARFVMGGMATLVLAACIIGTRMELRHWKDTATLFERAIAVTSTNWLAHVNLGNEYLRRKDYIAAINQFNLALQVRPELAEAEFGIGQSLAQFGNAADAVTHWQRAVELRPDYAEPRYSLALWLVEHKQLDEGVAALLAITQADPNFPDAHLLLGIILADQGRVDEAISHLAKAVELAPDNVHAARELERARQLRSQPPAP